MTDRDGTRLVALGDFFIMMYHSLVSAYTMLIRPTIHRLLKPGEELSFPLLEASE